MLAEGVDNIQSGIEPGGLVESAVIGHSIYITLTVWLVERVATIVDGAEHLPFHEGEVLIDAIFEDSVLAVLILPGDVLLALQVGELRYEVFLLLLNACDEGENLVVLSLGGELGG